MATEPWPESRDELELYQRYHLLPLQRFAERPHAVRIDELRTCMRRCPDDYGMAVAGRHPNNDISPSDERQVRSGNGGGHTVEEARLVNQTIPPQVV